MPFRVVVTEIYSDTLEPPGSVLDDLREREGVQQAEYDSWAARVQVAPDRSRLPDGFRHPNPPHCHSGKPIIRNPSDGLLAAFRSLAVLEFEVRGGLPGRGAFSVGLSRNIAVEEAKTSNILVRTPGGETLLQRFKVRLPLDEEYGYLQMVCRSERTVIYGGVPMASGDILELHFCHNLDTAVYPPTVAVRRYAAVTYVPLVPGQSVALTADRGEHGFAPVDDLIGLEYAGDADSGSQFFRTAVFRQTCLPITDDCVIVSHRLYGDAAVVVPGMLWKASQYVPVVEVSDRPATVWCGNIRYVMLRFQEDTSVEVMSPEVVVRDRTARRQIPVRVTGGWLDVTLKGGVCRLSRR